MQWQQTQHLQQSASMHNQLMSLTAADPFTGTFVVGASGGAGTLGFQWQVQTASQSARWANLEDAGVYGGTGTSTLTITGCCQGRPRWFQIPLQSF